MCTLHTDQHGHQTTYACSRSKLSKVLNKLIHRNKHQEIKVFPPCPTSKGYSALVKAGDSQLTTEQDMAGITIIIKDVDGQVHDMPRQYHLSQSKARKILRGLVNKKKLGDQLQKASNVDRVEQTRMSERLHCDEEQFVREIDPWDTVFLFDRDLPAEMLKQIFGE